jgi:N-acetylglucosaminyl-diphospho-decaprenol L-rhamnosyltransferase
MHGMISALIVTYNSEKWIGLCLESLVRFGEGLIRQIIVVDNGSEDATLEQVRRFPQITCVAAGSNLGFAAAVNRAARQATGDSLLILNPDCICRSPLGPLEEVLMHSEKIVAVAPRLVDSAGQFQRGFAIRRLPTVAALVFEILLLNRIFPSNLVNRRYRCLDFNPEQEAAVEQPAGACLLVRRASFAACGGMDEGFYPLWFEDVDLCNRLRQGGGIILYSPVARFEHAGGHSLETVSFSEKQVYWYRNLLYYVRKHFGWGTGAMVRAALLVGVGLRIFAELIAAVLNRKTPARVRGQRLRAYWRAARLSFSAVRGGPRVSA